MGNGLTCLAGSVAVGSDEAEEVFRFSSVVLEAKKDALLML